MLPGSRAPTHAGNRLAGPALLLGLATLLPACGGEPRTGRPEVGQPAPAYRGATLSGDTLDLRDLRGRPVLLNLWASWCVPCRTETPYLQALHERYRERGLEVVGVSVDNRTARNAVHDFVEEFGVTYTIVHDPEGRALDTFSALGLPATFVLDGEGTIRFLRIGPVVEGEEAFEGVLERAVDGSETPS